MIDDELLRILCCPETHQPLTLADGEMIRQLNDRISHGEIQNRSGTLMREPMEGGLIREDRQVLYPVRHKIPVLLVDEAIPL